jgi:hypothetical protein
MEYIRHLEPTKMEASLAEVVRQAYESERLRQQALQEIVSAMAELVDTDRRRNKPTS